MTIALVVAHPLPVVSDGHLPKLLTQNSLKHKPLAPLRRRQFMCFLEPKSSLLLSLEPGVPRTEK